MDIKPTKKLISIISLLGIILTGTYFVLGNTGQSGPAAAPNLEEHGLVGHWNFEEGSGQTISDRSGNGNDGTLGANSSVGKDDPVFAAGHDSSGPGGTGMDFDGVDDYITVTQSSSINNLNNLTISSWVFLDSFGEGTYGRISEKDGAYKLFVNDWEDGLWFEATRWDTDGKWRTEINTITLNQWHYITVVYNYSNISNVPIIYLNGVAQSVIEQQAPVGAISDETAMLYIGNRADGARTLDGLIDSVRIYNRALSADEIRMLYNQKKPIFHAKMDEGSGQIAYDASFNNNDGTIYGAAGTADSGTTTTLTDAKSWTADEWIGETVTIHTGTCSTVSRTITDNDATSITVSDWDSCTPDATSQYKITSKDEWTTGKFGSGLDFDGVDDYVDVGDITVEGTDLTISAWIFVNEIDNDQRSIITKFDNALDNRAFMFGVDLGGSIRFYTFDATTTTRKKTATGVISTGTWHNVVVVYDYSANDADIYVNNVLKANSQNDDVLHKIPNIVTHAIIGGRACGGDDMNGSIDDVRIYNYARTADEIRADYSAGKAAHLGENNQRSDSLVGHWTFEEGSGQMISDRSGNGNDGTLGANSSVGKDDPVFAAGHDSSGPGGMGMSFDGVDDYVDIADAPELDNTTTMSWSFWIKSNDVMTSNLGMVTKYEAVNGERSWAIRNRDVAGEIDVGISSDGIAYEFKGSTSFGLQIGVITHVVITYNSGTVTWYKDGVFVETAENTQTSIFAGSHNVEIGKYRTNYFNGLIDDVRIYNRALSTDEVRMLYNQKKPIFHAKMDEGSGQTAYDESFDNNDGTIYGAAGTADSGTTTTLTDAKSWTADEWIGETVTIHTGTCSTVSRTITDNNATSITVSDWDSCTPDATSQYKITSKDEWTTGKFGSGLDFDGVDDWVDAGDAASLNIVGDFTIGAWIKTTDATLADQAIISNTKTTANWNGWGFAFNRVLGASAIGDLGFWVSDGDSGHYEWLHRAHGISDTDWHYVGVLWDDSAGTATFYVDGVSIGTDTNAYGFNYTGAVYKHIGANCGLSYFFNGSIDDVRIYNYARTADEIRVDYNAGLAAHLGNRVSNGNSVSEADGLVGYWNFEEGSGQTISDRSGNGNDGTLGANDSVGKDDSVFFAGHDSSGPGGMGMSFDGVDDYVGMQYASELDFGSEEDISMTVWIKTESSGIQSEQEVIGSLNDETGAITARLFIDNYGSTHGVCVGNLPITDCDNAGFFTPNEWYFVTFVYNGSQMIFYRNGVVSRTIIQGGAIPVGNDGGKGVDIGQLFVGTIDEVRIYNRALSEDEIRMLYNQKKPIFHAKMDEGSGQTAYDESFNNNDGTLGATSGVEASDPTWVEGKYGGALSFDGGDDYVNAGSNSNVDNIFDNGGTVSAWINMNSYGSNERSYIVSKYTAGTGDWIFWVESPSPEYYNTLKFTNDFDGGTIGYWEARDELSTGTWHHVAVIYNSSSAANDPMLYVNGKSVTIDFEQSPTGSDESDAAKDLIIGGRTTDALRNFNGSIDEVRIYNYARSADEIKADYNNGLAARLR